MGKASRARVTDLIYVPGDVAEVGVGNVSGAMVADFIDVPEEVVLW